ncbi:MAG TPA: SDR family oxidoreductase [Usitatibacter sp.]|nr:SDR family oxidoreductase [Usitatibacter sp.]
MTAARDRFSLAGLNALVIGGSSGIGKAIAAGYLEAGARVAIAGRDRAKLDGAAAQLASLGDARAHCADAADPAALARLLDEVIAGFGAIDVLVNSQGTLVLKPAEQFTVEDWDRVIDTNLRSVFFACVGAGRHMLERGRGSIVNIGSLASFRGWPGSALYGMSKAGVVSLTETLAAEWATRGVRVNAIAPGFIMTDINRDKMGAERKARALGRTPMGRFGETEDIVGAAIYLASPSASYVTGETIRVDGGFLAAGL